LSAPVLPTAYNADDAATQARIAHNRALRDELWAKVAEAALGGNAKSRERHVARGKLLPSNACSIPARPSSKSGNWPRTACMKATCTAPA
jgi:hypothetical protein